MQPAKYLQNSNHHLAKAFASINSSRPRDLWDSQDEPHNVTRRNKHCRTNAASAYKKLPTQQKLR
ncbi:MAG: hypothetical protein ABIP35_10650 [Ginsengibacter sp.]